MQILGETNFDFLGRRNIFLALSLVLLAAGFASLFLKGGPKLGIDFKGGTLVYVKFQDAPDVPRIRQALTSAGLDVATLQPFDEGPDSHELKIDLNLLEEDSVATSGKDRIFETLRGLYPGEGDKLDFNNVGVDALASRLRANPGVSQSPLSSDEVTREAAALIDTRDTQHSGLVKEFQQLASDSVPAPAIMSALQEEAYLGAFAIRGVEVVGPKIGRDLQSAALEATLAALAGMLVYIAFRFEWIYGVAAVIAVFHDVLITIGFFSLFDREIELTVIAALLTLVGYSMNDTIVIFDRVRENRKLTRRSNLENLLNLSINQTLSRTVLTSGLTLVAVLCLFILGGEVLRGFSFALVVGVIVGSYSSIFIASPVLLWWRNFTTARVGASR